MRRRRAELPKSTSPSYKQPLHRTCAASTRVGTLSTTRSLPCTNRCAARRRTPRCTGWSGCWTAGRIRCMWDGAWCAWRSRTSAWRIRGRYVCAWMPARPMKGWARPRANSRWRRPPFIWHAPRSRMPPTLRIMRPARWFSPTSPGLYRNIFATLPPSS